MKRIPFELTSDVFFPWVNLNYKLPKVNATQTNGTRISTTRRATWLTGKVGSIELDRHNYYYECVESLKFVTARQEINTLVTAALPGQHAHQHRVVHHQKTTDH